MEKLFVQAPPRAAQIALPPRAVVPVKTFQHQQRTVARGAEEVAEGRERERLVVGKLSAHERAGAHVDLAVQAEPRRKRDQLAAGEQALEHTLRLGAVLCVKAGEHAVRALGTQVRRTVKRQQLGAQGGLTSGVAHGKVREGVALRGEAELPLAHEEREQSVRALRLDSAEKPLTQLRRADARVERVFAW